MHGVSTIIDKHVVHDFFVKFRPCEVSKQENIVDFFQSEGVSMLHSLSSAAAEFAEELLGTG